MEQSFYALLTQYFADTIAGGKAIGDDCAMLPTTTNPLAISTDTLVVGNHFFASSPPSDIACKALRSNISDILAVGATPKYFLLNLTLPNFDQDWCRSFLQALAVQAKKYCVTLIGGDTTQGALAVGITILGDTLGASHFVARNTAAIGQDVWLTGTIGAADCTFRNQTNVPDDISEHYWRPNLPNQFIEQMKQFMVAAIDISDGLMLDSQRLGNASQIKLAIQLELLPVNKEVIQFELANNNKLIDIIKQAAIGGEDYQILFCSDSAHRQQIQQLAKQTQTQVTKIGTTKQGIGSELLHNYQPVVLNHRGFQHFNAQA